MKRNAIIIFIALTAILLLICIASSKKILAIGSTEETFYEEYSDDKYPLSSELAMSTKSEDGVHNFNVILDSSGDNHGYICGLCGYKVKIYNGTGAAPATPIPTKIPTEQAGCGKQHESKWEEYSREEATCYTLLTIKYRCSVCGRIKEETSGTRLEHAYTEKYGTINPVYSEKTGVTHGKDSIMYRCSRCKKAKKVFKTTEPLPTPIAEVTPTSKPTKELIVTATPTSTPTVTPTITAINSWTKGDANLDGDTTGTDMLMIKRHIVGIKTLEGQAAKNADVNGDNEISTTDLLTLKKYIIGIIKQIG